MRKNPRIPVAFLLLAVTFIGAYPCANALGDPGDVISVINVPHPSWTGQGIGIAASCAESVTMYYTNAMDPFLHRMDGYGNKAGIVPMVDTANGAMITFGAIAWDETRQVLWGCTESGDTPIKVYQINPNTGQATFIFTAATSGCCGICDGISYDASDDTIYVSDRNSTIIDQHSASSPYFHRRAFEPTESDGTTPLGGINGVVVGQGNTMYLSRHELGRIDKIRKDDGRLIGSMATDGDSNVDLECDGVTFAPLTVIWTKDRFNNTVTAIEVEPGSCACGGASDVPIPVVSLPGVITLAGVLLAGTVLRTRRGA